MRRISDVGRTDRRKDGQTDHFRAPAEWGPNNKCHHMV